MNDSPDPSHPDLAGLRREYHRDGLTEADVDPDPIRQFDRWFADATRAGVIEPNAMTLGTAGNDGMPSTRTVLLKGFDARGFVFYTNYESRKARQIAENAQASLLFPWLLLERQVEICGTVEKVTLAETEKYFHSRPIASQLGAWASHQSAVLRGRDELESRAADVAEKFRDRTIPVPPFWGGYRLLPATIEFWQGRPSRLHDRLRYTRQENGAWQLERLSP